jgi:hypothetical protein
LTKPPIVESLLDREGFQMRFKRIEFDAFKNWIVQFFLKSEIGGSKCILENQFYQNM